MELEQNLQLALGLMPKSKEFDMVMRAIAIDRELSLKKKGIMISYPLSESIRYDTTIGGNTNINFKVGKIKFPSGATNTTTDLDGTLDKVRSLLLFCSDADAKIFLDGKQIIADHTLWHSFEDIDIERLDIQFPTDKSPNAFAFGFIISDKPFHPAKNSLFISHDIRSPTQTSTTDSYVTTLLRHVACYDSMVLTTKNTHATRSMTMTVSYSADGSTWYNVSGYTDKAIAALVTDELDISVKYHFLRVQVKSTVAATPATFTQVLQCAR